RFIKENDWDVGAQEWRGRGAISKADPAGTLKELSSLFISPLTLFFALAAANPNQQASTVKALVVLATAAGYAICLARSLHGRTRLAARSKRSWNAKGGPRENLVQDNNQCANLVFTAKNGLYVAFVLALVLHYTGFACDLQTIVLIYKVLEAWRHWLDAFESMSKSLAKSEPLRSLLRSPPMAVDSE
ncbi:hypothetical protein LTR17_026882, partial [Elasticomyces elasticus]